MANNARQQPIDDASERIESARASWAAGRSLQSRMLRSLPHVRSGKSLEH